MKHVGINCLFLVPGETGGMEVAVRALLPALQRAAPAVSFTAFVNVEAAGQDLGVEQIVVPVRARHRAEWVFGEQARLPLLAQHRGCEVVHSPGGLGPLWGDFARVVTIHDLHHRTMPSAHFGVRSHAMRVLVPAVARRATRVITASQHSRAQLEQLLHLRPDKVDVIPHGVVRLEHRPSATPPARLRADLGLGSRPVVLALSAKRPHKNLVNLLTALALLDGATRPIAVLPGYPTPHEAALRQVARDLDIEADVRFTGWLPDADVEGLLETSTVFVHPALEEGFGLPVLEAMAHGLPVACSGRPPLTEVADGCAAFFDPTDPSDMARTIAMLLADEPRARALAAAGRMRAASYSWSATAEATLASYDRAVTGRRRASERPGSRPGEAGPPR